VEEKNGGTIVKTAILGWGKGNVEKKERGDNPGGRSWGKRN